MTDTTSSSGFSEKQKPVMDEQHSYSEDGVDLTLIRWMLSLTLTERLQVLQQNVQSLKRLTDESFFNTRILEEKKEEELR
jgi:hypothetical protein